MLTLYAILHDEPGILSRFLSEMYKYGINIITVNQNIPIDSVASVTLSLRIEKEDFDAESFSQNLKEMPGWWTYGFFPAINFYEQILYFR